ncbi:MAG TPA: hypothetical protein VN969_11975 [Streptosporangiaceae bacterium]|jgi:hypothetical protein|nr:hypothetical protein [Streptosporangiaceae bacterium]
MFSEVALLCLTISALVASIACALTLAAGAPWPIALLSGGGAAGAALGLVPQLLGGKTKK